MNLRLLFTVSISICFINFSCQKSVVNNGIAGKWKLIAVFDGYVNGGNFQWNQVIPENSHTLKFTSDGSYQKAEMANGSQLNCTGTYVVKINNEIEITSICNTVTEKAFISELSPTILILDCSVIEGKIRYKYAATE